MDVNTLMKLALSANSTSAISKNTTASSDQVSEVLTAVLPLLLNGATAQATNKDTSADFIKAMAQHGTADTSDLTKFLGAVDTDDGAKIVNHLLGANTQADTKKVAKASGVSEKDVAKIMALAAPLLMSVLGQQSKKHADGNSALLQTVLGGAKNSGISAGDVVRILGKIIK